MIFFPLIVQNSNFYSMDPDYGVFGWLGNMSNFLNVMLIVCPITGILGNIGYFTAYKYFPMQIVAAAILIEPFIGQLVGILLGQDEIPGIKTGLGLVVISIGFMIASYGVTLKQDEEIKMIIEESQMLEQEMTDREHGKKNGH